MAPSSTRRNIEPFDEPPIDGNQRFPQDEELDNLISNYSNVEVYFRERERLTSGGSMGGSIMGGSIVGGGSSTSSTQQRHKRQPPSPRLPPSYSPASSSSRYSKRPKPPPSAGSASSARPDYVSSYATGTIAKHSKGHMSARLRGEVRLAYEMGDLFKHDHLAARADEIARLSSAGSMRGSAFSGGPRGRFEVEAAEMPRAGASTAGSSAVATSAAATAAAATENDGDCSGDEGRRSWSVSPTFEATHGLDSVFMNTSALPPSPRRRPGSQGGVRSRLGSAHPNSARVSRVYTGWLPGGLPSSRGSSRGGSRGGEGYGGLNESSLFADGSMVTSDIGGLSAVAGAERATAAWIAAHPSSFLPGRALQWSPPPPPPMDWSAPSQSASALYCAAESMYGEGEGNLIERFDQPGARLLSAVASPSEMLGKLVYGPAGEPLGYAALAQVQSRCAQELHAAVSTHETLLSSLRAYLGSVARARRALPAVRTPLARTASAHTSWLGPAARASAIHKIAAFFIELRSQSLAVVSTVQALREASKARGKVALQLAVEAGRDGSLPAGKVTRVVRQASIDLGASSTIGQEALRAISAHRPWLPLPLDVDPLLVSWFDPAKFRPLWAPSLTGKGWHHHHQQQHQQASFASDGASVSTSSSDAAMLLAPVSEEEVPPAKKAHSLATFMRITSADAALQEELPPVAAELFRSIASGADGAGGVEKVEAEGGKCGGESDAAVLVEAELILYGGAGRYALARTLLARFVERDTAAKQLQKKALLTICKPRAGRKQAGAMGREAAATVIQNCWRTYSDAQAERKGLPRRDPKAAGGGGRGGGRGAKRGARGGRGQPKKDTYEQIIQRLRISMYVRKIQLLFRSPAYQRQAYLRRKSALKMQGLVRQGQSARVAALRAKAKKDAADGVMQRHGGLAQMDALDVM